MDTKEYLDRFWRVYDRYDRAGGTLNNQRRDRFFYRFYR